MRVGEVVGRFDAAFPFRDAEPGDPVGLQVGDPGAVARRVLTCHEVDDGVLAIARAGDCVVAYHPLIFGSVAAVVGSDHVGRRVLGLARANAALVVLHTAVDVAPGGTNDVLAAALGLQDVMPLRRAAAGAQVKVVVFVPEDALDAVHLAMTDAGAGRIGQYDGCAFATPGEGRFRPLAGARPAVGRVGEPERTPEWRLEMVAAAADASRVLAAARAQHPYEEMAADIVPLAPAERPALGRVGALTRPRPLAGFARAVGRALGARSVRVAGDAARVVRQVAVVAGAGGGLMDDAVAAGADVIVTGDARHHSVRRATAGGLAVIDAGHAETERPFVASLPALAARVTGLPVVTAGADASPWIS